MEKVPGEREGKAKVEKISGGLSQVKNIEQKETRPTPLKITTKETRKYVDTLPKVTAEMEQNAPTNTNYSTADTSWRGGVDMVPHAGTNMKGDQRATRETEKEETAEINPAEKKDITERKDLKTEKIGLAEY